MAEKRVRRTRVQIIDDKIAKAQAEKEKYQAKIAELDEQIQALQDEQNTQRQDEVMEAIRSAGLSIDDAIAKIKG